MTRSRLSKWIAVGLYLCLALVAVQCTNSSVPCRVILNGRLSGTKVIFHEGVALLDLRGVVEGLGGKIQSDTRGVISANLGGNALVADSNARVFYVNDKIVDYRTYRFQAGTVFVSTSFFDHISRCSASQVNEASSIVFEVSLGLQCILLKADDLGAEGSIVTPEWRRFVNFIQSKGLRAGIGLIGRSLESDNDTYTSEIKSIISTGNIELWNHGYDHYVDIKASKYEFQGRTLDYQMGQLVKTQELARQKLGVTLVAFGAPGNYIDANTAEALRKIDDITIWLYGIEGTPGKLVLKREVNIEQPTLTPNYEHFVRSYKPSAKYLVLQIHPGTWKGPQFAEFERIINYLISSGRVQFCTPSDLATALSETRSGK